MGVPLTQGTKEIVPVDIIDRTGVVTDLSTASPEFDLVEDDETPVYTAEAATAIGMRVNCLIDTSAAGPSGLLAVARYRLYVKFTVGTEEPRIGPIEIFVKA